jgi:transcriptional regulator with XRE-family HTH domain
MSSIRHHQAVCAETIRLLRAERERQKLSNYVVSKRSGVSQSMLSLIEHGERNPSLEIMLRMAGGIGVDLEDVLRKARSTVSKKIVK